MSIPILLSCRPLFLIAIKVWKLIVYKYFKYRIIGMSSIMAAAFACICFLMLQKKLMNKSIYARNKPWFESHKRLPFTQLVEEQFVIVPHTCLQVSNDSSVLYSTVGSLINSLYKFFSVYLKYMHWGLWSLKIKYDTKGFVSGN